MSLNIKDSRVHELARLAAKLSGLSQTRAVERALEELIDRLETTDNARGERIAAILADVDARLTDADRRALATDMLYDEHGLPA